MRRSSRAGQPSRSRARGPGTRASRGPGHCQAERHPDLCACLNDGVIFLAGGSRVLPVPDLRTITVEQADAPAAQLRGA